MKLHKKSKNSQFSRNSVETVVSLIDPGHNSLDTTSRGPHDLQSSHSTKESKQTLPKLKYYHGETKTPKKPSNQSKKDRKRSSRGLSGEYIFLKHKKPTHHEKRILSHIRESTMFSLAQRSKPSPPDTANPKKQTKYPKFDALLDSKKIEKIGRKTPKIDLDSITKQDTDRIVGQIIDKETTRRKLHDSKFESLRRRIMTQRHKIERSSTTLSVQSPTYVSDAYPTKNSHDKILRRSLDGETDYDLEKHMEIEDKRQELRAFELDPELYKKYIVVREKSFKFSDALYGKIKLQKTTESKDSISLEPLLDPLDTKSTVRVIIGGKYEFVHLSEIDPVNFFWEAYELLRKTKRMVLPPKRVFDKVQRHYHKEFFVFKIFFNDDFRLKMTTKKSFMLSWIKNWLEWDYRKTGRERRALTMSNFVANEIQKKSFYEAKEKPRGRSMGKKKEKLIPIGEGARQKIISRTGSKYLKSNLRKKSRRIVQDRLQEIAQFSKKLAGNKPGGHRMGQGVEDESKNGEKTQKVAESIMSILRYSKEHSPKISSRFSRRSSSVGRFTSPRDPGAKIGLGKGRLTPGLDRQNRAHMGSEYTPSGFRRKAGGGIAPIKVENGVLRDAPRSILRNYRKRSSGLSQEFVSHMRTLADGSDPLEQDLLAESSLREVFDELEDGMLHRQILPVQRDLVKERGINLGSRSLRKEEMVAGIQEHSLYSEIHQKLEFSGYTELERQSSGYGYKGRNQHGSRPRIKKKVSILEKSRSGHSGFGNPAESSQQVDQEGSERSINTASFKIVLSRPKPAKIKNYQKETKSSKNQSNQITRGSREPRNAPRHLKPSKRSDPIESLESQNTYRRRPRKKTRSMSRRFFAPLIDPFSFFEENQLSPLTRKGGSSSLLKYRITDYLTVSEFKRLFVFKQELKRVMDELTKERLEELVQELKEVFEYQQNTLEKRKKHEFKAQGRNLVNLRNKFYKLPIIFTGREKLEPKIKARIGPDGFYGDGKGSGYLDNLTRVCYEYMRKVGDNLVLKETYL